MIIFLALYGGFRKEQRMNFIPTEIHPSWDKFLTSEVREQIHKIEKAIEKEKNSTNNYILLPEESNVLVYLTKNL